MTISGSNFVPSLTSVSFGAVPAQSVSVTTPTQLTVVTPPLCTGTYRISVSTPLGSTTDAKHTYTALSGPPNVTGLSSSSGSSGATAVVDVTGSNMGCASAAQVGLVGAAILSDPSSPNTATHIRVAVPPQPGGTQNDLIVTGPTGLKSAPTSADVFGWTAQPPSLSSASPSGTASQGGTAIVLTGEHLSFPTSVLFGSTPATTVTSNSDTQLTAVAPTGCGSTPITVVTAAGTSVSVPFSYSSSVPSVSAISPSSGPAGGGNTVVLTGTGFLCTTAVSFGSRAAASYHVDSDSQITATVPGASAGSVDVTVASSGGTSSTSSADLYTYVVSPTVSGVSPDAGTTFGGTPITITGQNFASGATVSIGGTLASSVTVAGPTTIQAVTPAGSAAPAAVIVTDPGGSSVQSSAAQFYYGVPRPSSVTPSAGTGAGGEDVRITGGAFAPDTTVLFGSQQVAATVLSPTLIDVPAAPSGSPGTTVAVTLRDPAGPGSSNSAQYTYAYHPSVTGISPNSGAASGGVSVTITGSAISVNPTVFFGSVAAATVTVNPNGSVTAAAPAGVAGTQVDVTVQTLGGRSTPNPPYDTFTYQAPPSGAMAPTAGPVAGGTYFIISGNNFFGSPSVTFGGIAATGVTVDSSTQIHGYSPAGPTPGSVSVVLTTGSGSTTVGTFAYDPAPTITGLSTNAGPAQGDAGTTPTVTITGTGFLHSVTVTFGSIQVVPTSVNVSGNSLTVVPPAELRGVVQVVANTAGGSTSTSAATEYAYGAPAIVPSTGSPFGVMNPGGPLNSTTGITISGTNFVPGATVTVGGTPATNVQVVNNSTITANVPVSSAAEITDVQVTTAGNLVSPLTSADQYTYGPPVLSSISSSAGAAAGGQPLTLAVSNFVNHGLQIAVGSVPVTPSAISLQGGGQATITIAMPSNNTTTSQSVQITMTTDGGASNAPSYTYWAAPAVSSVSPYAGPSIGGRRVTVTGSNFTAGNVSVSFGGVLGTSISVMSPTTLTAMTPAHGSGFVDVQVSSLGGTSSGSSSDRYQFMDQGYWIVETNGTMHGFNAAANYGGPTWSQHPTSGMAETPDGHGYWVVAQDGGVFTFGDAGFYGSMAGVALNRPVVGIAATPDGGGYWLVAGDGGVFTFGDAGFYGSTANVSLNRPISGMATTTDGRGYWLVSQDGSIWPFGGATGWGTYCCVSTRTMVGIASPDNGGYWEVQDDGGVFPIGDAGQGYGSMGGQPLNRPVFGMASSPSGLGYWLFAQDGGVFRFGDAGGWGSAAPVGSTAIGAAALFAA